MARIYNVLVIEEDPDMFDIHKFNLEELECEAVQAPLDLVEIGKYIEECDFILSDIVPMLDAEGNPAYDVIADIAARCNKDIILCTARYQEDLKNKKFTYYVAKPIPRGDLKAAVEACKNRISSRY